MVLRNGGVVLTGGQEGLGKYGSALATGINYLSIVWKRALFRSEAPL